MTLEDIKEWRKSAYLCFDTIPEISRIDWLIAEVERLQEEAGKMLAEADSENNKLKRKITELSNEAFDYAEQIEHLKEDYKDAIEDSMECAAISRKGATKTTAQRCAEICEEKAKTGLQPRNEWFGKFFADAIRKEFRL